MRKLRFGDSDLYSIQLHDKEIFDEYLKKCDYQNHLWSSNFDYLWADSQSDDKRILWRIVDDMLIPFVLLKKTGLHLVHLPFGCGTPEQVLYVTYKNLQFCNEWNRRNGYYPATVRTLNSEQMDFIRVSDKFDEYFEFMKINGVERYFSIQKLIQLVGKDFARIRNLINQFKRNYPQAMIREYNPDDYHSVLQVNKGWKETASTKYSTIFDDVYFYEIMTHYQELGHIILVVEIDKKIVGLVSGGITAPGQSWGCISKRLSQINGLNEAMIIEFAKYIHALNPHVELLNVGSDLGVDGLVSYKEKFRPVRNLERFRITLR
ncbi:hypothetical protein DFP93_1095 [Aneurinibacillus soli]|uniref:Phosphatidylglycerol lysyltransferase C-terminal domain-containing protein n=1 Tax=Aneurinibacillus soli TaxID=1500254 RepID=A0A0U4WGR1_9BACL|nr:phosphatidylglycerol lysyltransferase domain-containing protein [Aneurinibacillus soli]PYE61306.1 hypothetical protein DFP93_1095 [Aneurinibacillus soli]BAU27865.1 hypothetical protein CB4_02039 [Aneurinibacillus soli]